MKTKTLKHNVSVDTKRHLWLSQNHTAMNLAMYELSQYGVDILKHITEQAKVGGVCDENMQEFIETYLASEVVKNDIIEYAEVFVEIQKKLEEELEEEVENQKELEEELKSKKKVEIQKELEEELKSKKKVETQKATTVQYKLLKFNNYDLSRVMEVTALDELKKD